VLVLRSEAVSGERLGVASAEQKPGAGATGYELMEAVARTRHKMYAEYPSDLAITLTPSGLRPCIT
jgi:hypothetical protein